MLSLAASMVTSAACESACRYCSEGAAVPIALHDSYVAPCGTGHVRLGITVTLPANDAASPSGRLAPYPMVIFINGFQVCVPGQHSSTHFMCKH